MAERELVDAIGAVDRRIFEVSEMVSNNRFFLGLADLFGVRSDAVGGRHQKPMIDPPSIRLAEKLIDVSFRDFMCWRIALRLNGPYLPVFMLEDEIDSAISTPSVWILFPQPDLRYLRRPLWVLCQEPFDESLELPAPLDRVRIEAFVESRKRRHPLTKPRFRPTFTPLSSPG